MAHKEKPKIKTTGTVNVGQLIHTITNVAAKKIVKKNTTGKNKKATD